VAEQGFLFNQRSAAERGSKKFTDSHVFCMVCRCIRQIRIRSNPKWNCT
jgi:hypothetical protein